MPAVLPSSSRAAVAISLNCNSTATGVPRSVLVVRFSALGDVAIAVPVLYSVCLAYPATQFVMLTRKLPAKVLVERPANLIVEAVDTAAYKGVGGVLRLARELHAKHKITAVADLHSVMRSWVIGAGMALHGVKVARIDKGRLAKRLLVTGRRREQLATSSERYSRVFDRLGFTRREPFDGYHPQPTRVIAAKQQGERWVAVAPFSAHKGKVYPLPLMQQVVQGLTAQQGVKVILMGGGQAEREQLAAIEAKYPNCVSMAGIEHTFADEFAVMAQCDAMVSMDSANMHLASLVRCPVVSVWGATHPWAGFMGWQQSHDNAVQLDLPCRPCSVFGQKPCKHGDYRCLTGITPERILSQVSQVIHSKK